MTFFRRTRVDTRPWQTLIAPVLSALFIAALDALVLANFDTLIGGSMATAIPLILSIPVVLFIGVAYGKSGQRAVSNAPAGAATPEHAPIPWPGLGTDPDEPTDLLPA